MKDYPRRRTHLKLSPRIERENPDRAWKSTKRAWLAISTLPPATPEDMPNGLFWIARRADLSTDPKGKEQITKFGHQQVREVPRSGRWLGSIAGGSQDCDRAPANLATTITKYVPPTPEQQAADIVQIEQPKDMDFAEWELVLSEGKQKTRTRFGTPLRASLCYIPLPESGRSLSAQCPTAGLRCHSTLRELNLRRCLGIQHRESR